MFKIFQQDGLTISLRYENNFFSHSQPPGTWIPAGASDCGHIMDVGKDPNFQNPYTFLTRGPISDDFVVVFIGSEFSGSIRNVELSN